MCGRPSAGPRVDTFIRTRRVTRKYTKYVVQFTFCVSRRRIRTIPRRGLHSRHALQAYIVPLCGYASRRRVPCPGALSRGFPCRVRCRSPEQATSPTTLHSADRGTRICDLTRATVRLALSPDMLAPKHMLHTALLDMSITPRARAHLPHAARTTTYHNQPRTRLMHSTMRSSRRDAFAGGPLFGFGFGQG